MALSPDNPHKRGTIAYRRWEAAWRRREAGQLPFTDEHLTDIERRQKHNAIIQGGTFVSPTPENPLPTINTPDVNFGRPPPSKFTDEAGNFLSFEHYLQWNREEEAAGRGLGQLGLDDLFNDIFDPDTDFDPFDHIDVLDVVKGELVRPKVRA